MEENQEILLNRAAELAEKHAELKSIVYKMLDDMDAMELEYKKIIKKIKEK